MYVCDSLALRLQLISEGSSVHVEYMGDSLARELQLGSEGKRCKCKVYRSQLGLGIAARLIY